MKYSRQFYELIAHLNPALYDVIYPMGPVKNVHATSAAFIERSYQTKGSNYGTDFSGEYKLPVKLTWGMKNLTDKLSMIITQHSISPIEKANGEGANAFVSDLIEPYCGNTPRRIPFPPKPHGIAEAVTFEEKVSAAVIFAHASFAVQGSILEIMFAEGADKIIDSAMAQFTEATTKTAHAAFNNTLVKA